MGVQALAPPEGPRSSSQTRTWHVWAWSHPVLAAVEAVNCPQDVTACQRSGRSTCTALSTHAMQTKGAQGDRFYRHTSRQPAVAPAMWPCTLRFASLPGLASVSSYV